VSRDHHTGKRLQASGVNKVHECYEEMYFINITMLNVELLAKLLCKRENIFCILYKTNVLVTNIGVLMYKSQSKIKQKESF